VRGDGSVIDDAPAARVLVLHHLEGFLHAQEHAREVDVDHVLPFVQAELLERGARGIDAGVIEYAIDAAPLLLHCGEQRLDRILLRDVGRHAQGARARAGLLGGFFQHILAPPGQRDLPAVLQKSEGSGLADAAARARDDCNLVHDALP